VRPRRRGWELDVGERVHALEPLLTSERDEGDTYTIEPVPGDRPLVARWGRTQIVWPGPLSAAIARPFTLGRRVRGTMFVRVDAGPRLIRLTVEGVNLAGQHRVRMRIPVGSATASIADMAFGPVIRPRREVDPNTYPMEHPVPTAPMHRYVSAGQWTVFARGLHEYELTPDGTLVVTLLRAVGDLSLGSLRARPGHAGWPTPTPGAQQLGPFRAELAIAPLALTPSAGVAAWDDLERSAEAFHAPLAGYMCRAGIGVPPVVAGPRLEGAGLAFSTLKPRDDGNGVVLRCVNLTHRTRTGRWVWSTPISRAYRARLDETVEAELQLDRDRRTVSFDAGPRQIVTVIIEP
jgi:alpha-mannosidase